MNPRALVVSLLGAAMLALAGCQVAPRKANKPVPPPSQPVAPVADQSGPANQSAAAVRPVALTRQAAAPAPVVKPHAAFFVGQTHSAPSLTAVTMTNGSRLYLERTPVLKGEDIREAHDMVDKQGQHYVVLRLTEEGARKLSEASSLANKGKRLVLILNGRVAAAPVIGGALDHGSLAFRMPSAQSAANLVARIVGEQPPELKFKSAR